MNEVGPLTSLLLEYENKGQEQILDPDPDWIFSQFKETWTTSPHSYVFMMGKDFPKRLTLEVVRAWYDRFRRDNAVPKPFLEIVRLEKILLRSRSLRLLEGDVRSLLLGYRGEVPFIGYEQGRRSTDGIVCWTCSSGNKRYVQFSNRIIVAALQVLALKDGQGRLTTNAYCHPDHRGAGLMTGLIRRAQDDFEEFLPPLDQEMNDADRAFLKAKFRPRRANPVKRSVNQKLLDLARTSEDPVVLQGLAKKSIPVQIELAKNTSLPEETIRFLAHRENVWVRQGIAMNPVTPLDVLMKLVQDGFWRSVSQNPVFPLHRDNNADAGNEIDFNIAYYTEDQVELDAMAMHTEDRVARRALLSRGPDTNRVHVSELILAYLARSGSDFLKKSVAVCSVTPMSILAELAMDPSSEVAKAVASSNRVNGDILDTMLDRNDIVLWGVASHPNLHERTLDKIVFDNINPETVARNPKLTREHVDHLIKLDDCTVFYKLFSNTSFASTDQQIYVDLVQSAIASTSKDVSCSWPIWVNDMLGNDMISTDTLTRIKGILDGHLNSMHILGHDSKNKVEQMRRIFECIFAHPSMDPLMIRDHFMTYKRGGAYLHSIAINPSTPIDILRILAKNGDNVRMALAQNPRIPEDIAMKMADHEEVDRILKHLAENDSASPEALRRIYARGKFFWECLASNTSTPTDVLATMASCANVRCLKSLAVNESVTPEILARLAKNKSDDVRAEVASNSNTDAETILDLTLDKSWNVRRFAMNHPNRPEEAFWF